MAAAANRTDATALKRVKDIMSKVYADLGKELVDGESYDGTVVRAQIKTAILNAMRG
jgi:hypothetical protein